MRLLILFVILVFTSACDNYRDPEASTQVAQVRTTSDYASYGGDGGRQYAGAGLITATNVDQLKPLWSHHSGDVSAGSDQVYSTSSFQNTPILVEGVLYMCTPFNRVVALDPATGAEFWSYDPKIELKAHYSNQLVCRGVSYWQDQEKIADQTCARRIFTATNDTRLIALDASTGEPCQEFGEQGEVDTSRDVGMASRIGEHHHTSPPAIIGDVVVVGGSVSDGAGIDAPSGVVRAFDARSGKLLWGQDLAPPGFDYDSALVSDGGYALATPNVWAPMSTDEELGLIFAPTGNPLPDYFATTMSACPTTVHPW